METNIQYQQRQMISWWRTSFTDEEVQSLREAVLNEHISEGPLTQKLEKQLAETLGIPYVVMTTSGSVALLLALMALGIGQDDEVIVPNRTWIATAHAALMVGAKVKLVDVRADIPIMDVSLLRSKITAKTKVIMPVHLNGRAVNMREIQNIAKEHGLSVVEDAAQAFYSKNADGFLGTQSDIGCFSLGVSKLISTGQGGFVVTKRKDLYEKMKLMKNHGVVDNFTDTWNQMGLNFKFTDLLASFGLVQLARVKERVAHLKKVYGRYAEGLKNSSFLKVIPINVSEGEIPLYAEVLCPNRQELIKYLLSEGIQVRPVPPSLDISGYLGKQDDMPNSLTFSQQGMYLPCGPVQPLENVERVIEMSRSFYKT